MLYSLVKDNPFGWLVDAWCIEYSCDRFEGLLCVLCSDLVCVI